MEDLKGKFIEGRITKDDSLPLKNLQNIYFKNVGSKSVMIGQFELRADQEKYIHTGNITLDAKNLDISFIGGMGDKKDLYVHYIKMPDCTCD